MVNGLTHLREYWSSLVRNDRAKLLKIDVHTVQTLQLLAPGISTKDRTTAKGLVLSGAAFSNFTQSERNSIWKKMKKKDNIIPSLYTFFRNMRYLESCADCMKRLVALSQYRPTVKSAMKGIFKPADSAGGEYPIQTSETGFRQYTDSQADYAELGYRQLWLYAMRHYPNLARESESDDLVAKPNYEKADETALYNMAVLARELGFVSPQIEKLIENSPDRQIARATLLKARKPERYRYDSDSFESLISTIAGCFIRAMPIEHQLPSERTDGREVQLNSRCGHPRAKVQKQDCQYLFIDSLHTEEFPTAGKVSSPFVRRSVYFFFFGNLRTGLPRSSTSTANATPSLDAPLSPLFVPDHRSSLEPGDAMDESSSPGPTPHEGHNQDRQRRRETQRERGQEQREPRLRQRQHRWQSLSRTEHESTGSDSSTVVDTATSVDSDMSSITPQRLSPVPEEVDEIMTFDHDEPELHGVDDETTFDDDESEPHGIDEGMTEEGAKSHQSDPETPNADAADREQPLVDGTQGAAKQERLAREAQERAEQERLAREAQEIAEQRRVEQERAEQERLAREAQERAEEERLTREARERAEQERLERDARERAEQERVEQERAEQERLARDAQEIAEQERVEQERVEQERAEQERAEQERAEQERLATEAAEQAKEERLIREAAGRAEQVVLRPPSPVGLIPLSRSTQVGQGEDLQTLNECQARPSRRTDEERQALEQEKRPGRPVTHAESTNTPYSPQDAEGTASADQVPIRNEELPERRAHLTSETRSQTVVEKNIQPSHPIQEAHRVQTPRNPEGVAAGQQPRQAGENGSKQRRKRSSRPLGIKTARKNKQRHGPVPAIQTNTRQQATQRERPPKRITQVDFAAAQQPGGNGGMLFTGQIPHPRPLDAISGHGPPQTLVQTVDKPAIGREDDALLYPLRVEDVALNQEEQAWPGQHERPAEQERQEDRGGAATAEDVDEAFLEMFRDDAENRRLGEQSPDDRAEPSRNAQVEEEERDRVARERATALAQLQGDNAPAPSEVDAALAEPSRRITHIDMPHLIARWRQRGSQLESREPQTRVDFTRWTKNKRPELRPSTPQEKLSAQPTGLRPKLISRDTARATTIERPQRSQHDPDESVKIVFKARDEDGEWERVVHELADPLSVERAAKKDARNHQATFYDKDLRTIAPGQCFDAAVGDGTKTIFMTYGEQLSVDEETVASVLRSLDRDRDRERAKTPSRVD